MKRIYFKISIPREVFGDPNLNLDEKLIMSFYMTIELDEYYFKPSLRTTENALNLSVNSIRKHIDSLKSKGYLTNQGELTGKWDRDVPKSEDQRDYVIFSKVYRKKMPSGAKLLWALQNSNSDIGKRWSYYSSDSLATKLNCDSKSIQRWHKKLDELGLIKTFVKKTGNKTIKNVKTIDFRKVPKPKIKDNQRDKYWRKYISSFFGKDYKTSPSDTLILVEDMETLIDQSEEPKIVRQSLLYDIQKRKKKGIVFDVINDSLRGHLDDLD